MRNGSRACLCHSSVETLVCIRGWVLHLVAAGIVNDVPKPLGAPSLADVRSIRERHAGIRPQGTKALNASIQFAVALNEINPQRLALRVPGSWIMPTRPPVNFFDEPLQSDLATRQVCFRRTTAVMVRASGPGDVRRALGQIYRPAGTYRPRHVRSNKHS